MPQDKEGAVGVLEADNQAQQELRQALDKFLGPKEEQKYVSRKWIDFRNRQIELYQKKGQVSILTLLPPDLKRWQAERITAIVKHLLKDNGFPTVEQLINADTAKILAVSGRGERSIPLITAMQNVARARSERESAVGQT
ncbi:hypothetical protein HYW40_01695 [Candidatus Curtissbacteria bacterium]|nr:hypothetical protein [Candidatus Curtissbacteria bacterium]